MRLWYSGIANTDSYPESCRTGYTEGVVYQYDAGGVITPYGEFTIADAYSASSADNIALALAGGTFAIAGAYSASSADNLTLSQSSSVTWPIRSITGDARTLNKTLRRFVAGTWQ